MAILSLERNSNVVPVSPYTYTLDTSTKTGAITSRYQYVSNGASYRIRQSGTVVKIKIAVGDLTGITVYKIQIWRPFPTNAYKLVGNSENLIGTLVANSVNEITLTSPIANAQSGDLAGALIEGNGSNFLCTQVDALSSLFTRTNLADVGTSFNWPGATNVASTASPIEIQMQASDYICTGDSIMQGMQLNLTASDRASSGVVWKPEASIGHHLHNIIMMQTGYLSAWSDVSISGQTTAQILARFAVDVRDKAPRIAIFNGGNNDINTSVPKATTLSNIAGIVDLCLAATVPILPVYLCMPSNNGWSNAQMQDRDDRTADIKAMFASTYPTALWVDPNPYVSQFRVGGDANNLWDQKPEYSAGDSAAHFNSAGYNRIAYAIAIKLNLSKVQVFNSGSWKSISSIPVTR